MKGAAAAVRVFVPVVDERYDAGGFGPVEPLAEELPLPSDLGEDKILVVLPGEGGSTAFFGKVLGKVFGKRRRPAHVHRAVRGAALLARGYADVSGGSFGEHPDAVWGFTSTSRRR